MLRRITTGSILRGAVIVTLACLVHGQALAAVGGNEDPGLLRDIQRAIERYAYITVFDHVTVDIDHEGIVVLSGHVTAPHKRGELADRVAVVTGVVGVQNDIDVLPASRFDTELRYRVARTIYSSSTFWQYAARRNPPIHVIVKGGHVTLAGQVDSEADRAMAGILASNSAALSLTNELTLPRERRRESDSLD